MGGSSYYFDSENPYFNGFSNVEQCPNFNQTGDHI